MQHAGCLFLLPASLTSALLWVASPHLGYSICLVPTTAPWYLHCLGCFIWLLLLFIVLDFISQLLPPQVAHVWNWFESHLLISAVSTFVFLHRQLPGLSQGQFGHHYHLFLSHPELSLRQPLAALQPHGAWPLCRLPASWGKCSTFPKVWPPASGSLSLA